METHHSQKEDFILYHQRVGVLNSTAIPTDLTDQLKSYSGWKVGSLTIQGDLTVNKVSQKQDSDTSKNLDTSNIDCSSTSSSNQCPMCNKAKVEIKKELLELYKDEKIK